MEDIGPDPYPNCPHKCEGYPNGDCQCNAWLNHMSMSDEDKKACRPPAIKHILGPFENFQQFCIMCGECIFDYRNAAWEQGHEPSGWAEGELYLVGKNPQVFLSTPPDDRETINCTNR